MNPQQLKGHWKGEFTYGPSYGEEWNGVKESFALYIDEVNDGSFTGRCIDLDTVAGAEFIEARVTGFWENNLISFTKEYPFEYSLDEDNRTIVNKAKKGHTVTYEGEFNHSQNSFSGVWDITYFFRLLWFKLFQQRYEGTWMMYKDAEDYDG